MFASPFPDVEIPDLSVSQYLFDDLTDDELDRTALIDGLSGASTSYRELRDQVAAIAGYLAARGLAVGDVVALLCPNIPAFAAVFHGVLRAGGTVTTVNSLSTVKDVAAQMRSSGATWLITVSPLLATASEAAASEGLDAEHLVVLDGAPGHPSLRDLLGSGDPAPDIAIDPATHAAVLPYSSGTTALPKAVRLSHRNLVANVAQVRDLIRVDAHDRVLALLPFFHIYGMTVLLNLALRQRATLVTMPRFDLGEFLRIVSEYRCSYLFVAPPVALALAKHPTVDGFDLSSVHTVLSGAAPLDGSLAEAVARRLGCEVLQGYGMTELSPVSHVIPRGRHDLPRDSVGLTVPNSASRLVDLDTGADILPPTTGVSARGELWYRGPNVMLGYLDNPEATRATIDDGGWLHTGDVATVGADGSVTIVDRLKELIKYKGYQVAPAELEALLLSHEAIADAAVIGVPDDEGQEIPKAFVVVQEGASLSADDVAEFVGQRVAPYKKVREVEFVDVIPKSAAGKILRKDLRARV